MKATASFDTGIFERFAEDRMLVLQFFLVFARFEYALKRSGFLRGNESKVEPDWDRFADSLKDKFERSDKPDFIEALHYLNEHPPQKQVVRKRELGWAPNVRDVGESREKWVLRLVRTVRNNLFHGGKYPYPDGPIHEPARDRMLLSASLTVLEECLRLSPLLEARFFEVA
jgi:hypothetical protein